MATRGYLAVWLSGLATLAYPQEAPDSESVPTSVGPLHRDGNFVSLAHRGHPGNRIGYRFHEHAPFVFGEVPSDGNGIDATAVERLEAEFAQRAGVLINRREVREEGWHPQDWTYYIAPAPDGFDLLWVVETHDTGLNEFYAVQQCFRMGGVTNGQWRRTIAETPSFSEFDLWATEEKQGRSLTSLSHVRSQNHWATIPATRENVGYRTRLGLDMDRRRSDNKITEAALEPYNPTVQEEILDCGLAARADVEGEWVCAIYWERTTHITNHHPADCLHAVVNLGPIPPRGKRALRGKIYWTRASLEELYATWQDNFPRPVEGHE
jgi:hypothetical protein